MNRPSRRQFVQGSLVLAGLSLCAACGNAALPWLPVAAGPKLPRIGYLALSPADIDYEAFRDGLRELGYVEGQTIAIEMRLAESAEYFPALAAELVAVPVDLIVSVTGTLAAQAAIGATRTIPIVFTDLP